MKNEKNTFSLLKMLKALFQTKKTYSDSKLRKREPYWMYRNE